MTHLYIDRPGAEISLDGPALKIRAPGKAAQLLPLARLRRVHAQSNCRWQTKALMQCARLGIPVLFHEADSRLLGRLAGARAGNPQLGRLLEAVSLRPDWPELYSQWLDAMRLQTLRYLARRNGLDFDSARELETLQPALDQQAARLAGRESATETRRWILLHCHGWMTEQLADLGLDRGLTDAAGEPLDLIWDLGHLHALGLYPLKLNLLRRKHGPLDRPYVTRVLEQHWRLVDRQGARLIGRFQRWLHELA